MSVPWIGSRPPTAPTPPNSVIEWPGKCPGCGNDVTWRAVASNSGDYTRTKVEYSFSDCACPSVEEAKEIA